jgi:hypothetical protein
MRTRVTLVVKATITLGVVIGHAVPTAVVIIMTSVRGKILPTVILEVHLRKTALRVGFHGSVARTLHAECRVLVNPHIGPWISRMTDASMLTVALAYFICPAFLNRRLAATFEVVDIVPACYLTNSGISCARLAVVRISALFVRLACPLETIPGIVRQRFNMGKFQ